LFYVIEDGIYVGIDNSSGDSWTEEFIEKTNCFRWLMREIDTEEAYEI